jgi:hypothetical protein
VRNADLRYWALQLLGWGFYFYAQASGEVIFASQPWSKAGTLWGGVCLASLGLTHAVRWVVRRQGWLALAPAALLGRMVAATALVSLVAGLTTAALSQVVYGKATSPIAAAFYQKLTAGGQLRNQFVFIAVVHVAWVALYLSFAMQGHRYRAQLRQAQLDEALQAAELRLLRSQLNPHFLFNALNGVRSLIADDPQRARDALTQLARLLRHTLASSDQDLHSLERELEMVDDYLALEGLRLADRLRVELEVEPAARSARIPSMLLQTLVENAIKHGVAALKEGGTLRIRAQIVDRELRLDVVNPRPQAGADSAAGVGLSNAARRLRLLFGNRASLGLDLSQPSLAIAVVRLPA